MAIWREENNNPVGPSITRGGRDNVTGVTYPSRPDGFSIIPPHIKALYDRRLFFINPTNTVPASGHMRVAFRIYDPQSINGVIINSAIFTSDQPIRVQAYAGATVTGGTSDNITQACMCELMTIDNPNLCSTANSPGKYSLNPTVNITSARKIWDILIKDGPLSIYGGEISSVHGFGFYMPPEDQQYFLLQFQNLGNATATISAMVSLMTFQSSGRINSAGEIIG